MVMRVAHVTPVYPPYRGGIGAVAAEYARGLRAQGVAVTVFTPDYHAGRKTEEDVVRLKPWYAWGLAAFVPQLLWKLRGFDVIHIHHTFYGGEEAAALASVLWRIPLVVTYHMQPKAAGWVGLIMRLHRMFVEPFILWRAKKILVSSRDYAIENGLSNESAFSSETAFSELPFGVDTQRFSPGRDDAFRVAHGIPLDVKVVVFVGGLDDAHYFKGLSVLLRAMQQNDAHLLVVGSGNRQSIYENEARQLGIADRVHFAGSVPFADLPRAYRSADVHVLPSIDRSEAFGLVTLEAMATGIPSIVSDLSGMRTLVMPGDTGLLTPAGDVAALAQSLKELLQQDGRRLIMGGRARERATSSYAAHSIIDRLLAIYASL